MATTVLILGLKATVVDDVRERLDIPDIEIRSGLGLEDMKAVFAETKVDHVLMGAGLELELRLGIVRAVFEMSDTTTVHMKDKGSGSEGFGPFVQAVLTGLHGIS
ncbi:hypothetical protein OHB26_16975 [Nocardia sp. NBC_01503]|uniref:hypothetical protein n=1 Tax=Nocardia sp. NBC_01503 TaxID=2975997 RepID=UPI002E7ABCEA|nr:hypothetical protein [Nocardia sp. NBC_01503]WTL35738.1 hypothetical protein OHB26_16975 [Nocardia sp. NBC_01503]